MTHIARIGARLGVIAAVAGACSGSDDSRAAESGTGATDSATLAASEGSSATPRVSNVMIGRQVGPGNRITDPSFEFGPKDTVHVSVATTGSGQGIPLTAAWRSQSGEILLKSSEPTREGENADFQLSDPKGLKPGTYKVILFLGEDSVDTKVFVVKK
jgi:hypothetical protein